MYPGDICDYCGKYASSPYTVILERAPEGFHKDLYASGHKWCVSALSHHYKRTGKIMTLAEVELESFDPGI